jgi:acyl carrier protein
MNPGRDMHAARSATALSETVRRLVARYGRAVKVVSMSSAFKELGVDAVAVAQIVIDLEARFGITVEPREAASWTTGNEIFATVTHLLNERDRDPTKRRERLYGTSA